MRLVTLLKGKIHHAIVTDANVDYIGSITVDSDLLERSGILVGELVHVWNVTNGERLTTYALAGEKHSGTVQINGSAAHRATRGDKVIIAAFVHTDEPVEPKIVLVDEQNRFSRYL